MPVITISRQFGSGGRTLGQKLAGALGYTFADQDIVQKIAELAKVSPGWVESVEKEAGGRFQRIVSKMVSKPLVDRILKDERGYIDEQIYIDYLVVLIAQIAEEDNVVILGRGSQYILNDMPEAYHILLIDNFENRVRFIMEKYDKTEKEAANVVKVEDRRRFNLYKKIGKQDYDKPELYHLVINMARVSLDQAHDLIVKLIKQPSPVTSI
ncbi:MAG: cytidylate kinase-like family protein [Desulfobacteraceae bacterium]|nr:cytidylate kinase-like family protein [Desulfobacteraceae bacterium]